jgi:hypothetical protein
MLKLRFHPEQKLLRRYNLSMDIRDIATIGGFIIALLGYINVYLKQRTMKNNCILTLQGDVKGLTESFKDLKDTMWKRFDEEFDAIKSDAKDLNNRMIRLETKFEDKVNGKHNA